MKVTDVFFIARDFKTAYKFVCEYKSLGEQYILSAKVHMDEESPHMHLVFIPVVHTKDKKGNNIDKVACSEFWKDKDSYRQLQDAFYNYIVSNNFELERGCPSARIHLSVEQNSLLTLTLESQVKTVEKALKYEKERKSILAENRELKDRCENMENDFSVKLKEEAKKIEDKYENKIYHLESENNYLRKIINTLKQTLEKVFIWISNKFSISEEYELIRKFELDTDTYIEPEKQIKNEEELDEFYDLDF